MSSIKSQYCDEADSAAAVAPVRQSTKPQQKNVVKKEIKVPPPPVQGKEGFELKANTFRFAALLLSIIEVFFYQYLPYKIIMILITCLLVIMVCGMVSRRVYNGSSLVV